MAAWDLAETALDFHDRNCVGCTFRKAMGFPNLSTLLAEREQRQAEQRAAQERVANEHAALLAAREAARQKIRGHAGRRPSHHAGQHFRTRSRRGWRGSAACSDSETRAGNIHVPAITDHLFQLIESQEPQLVSASLEALTHLPVDQTRLCNAALFGLRSYALREVAGAIVEKDCASRRMKLSFPAPFPR